MDACISLSISVLIHRTRRYDSVSKTSHFPSVIFRNWPLTTQSLGAIFFCKSAEHTFFESSADVQKNVGLTTHVIQKYVHKGRQFPISFGKWIKLFAGKKNPIAPPPVDPLAHSSSLSSSFVGLPVPLCVRLSCWVQQSAQPQKDNMVQST